jgi:hypothetical protein
MVGALAEPMESVRTTNAIERLHEEFKRRIKTQTVLPSADTAAMLFWALLASGQTTMRKVDGWQTLATISQLTSLPDQIPSTCWRDRRVIPAILRTAPGSLSASRTPAVRS